MAGIPDGMRITWLGHATFLVEAASGTRILIEAWVQSNPMCPEGLKDVGSLDAILLTHGHADHIGDIVEIATRTRAPVICTPEINAWLDTKGVEDVVEMNKGGTVQIADVKVHMTHAIHSGGIDVDAGVAIYGGEPAGYVIEFADGFRLYHAGDTCVFSDMALIAKLLKPDVAMLPIGDHYTMGPESAAEAVRLLGVKTVIPMHYGTFPILVGSPKELKDAAMDVDGLHVYEIEPGDSIP